MWNRLVNSLNAIATTPENQAIGRIMNIKEVKRALGDLNLNINITDEKKYWNNKAPSGIKKNNGDVCRNR